EGDGGYGGRGKNRAAVGFPALVNGDVGARGSGCDDPVAVGRRIGNSRGSGAANHFGKRPSGSGRDRVEWILENSFGGDAFAPGAANFDAEGGMGIAGGDVEEFFR